MKTKNLSIKVLSLIIFVGFISCNPEQKKETSDNSKKDSIPTESVENKEVIVQAQKNATIFYYLPSPTEMSKIFDRANSLFYPEILFPIENQEKYQSANKQAMVLGIYGADLGYIQIFQQSQYSLNYLATIKKLSAKLGIPEVKINQSFSKLEKNLDNKDEMYKILKETFDSTETFLKNNNQGDLASKIILGGWVESLYLATEIIKKEEQNSDITQIIAEQKYSLNTMIELISHNQDSKEMTEILDNLLLLKNIYKPIEITFKKSGFSIDTAQKTIKLDQGSQIKITKGQIDNITRIIKHIRDKIIE